MPYQVIFTDELYHHGIKGQKWGIRRFRKKDGSLTKEGEERYARNEKRKSTAKKVAIGAGIVGAGALTAYGAHKYRQHIRNKASKRQIEIGKKAVTEALKAKNQSDMNYRFLKTSGDIKGAIKEKQKARNYGKIAKKFDDYYTRKAHKLRTGKYKNAKNFLLVNHKPIDYLEDFASGAAVGAVGTGSGLVIRRKINQKKERSS